MRIWVAYKFREEDPAEVRERLTELKNVLAKAGHQQVTMFEDIQNWKEIEMPMVQVVQEGYELMKTCDAGLCLFAKGDSPSEGRGWEAGYLVGLGKPTIMAVHKSLNRSEFNELLYCENPANKANGTCSVIEYENLSNIAEAL
ncbi:MAG: nucleoside 2-deoxyribosyltransferase [Candidatus Uhrbacteria bacterium]